MSKRKTRMIIESALEFVEHSQDYIIAAHGKMFEASVSSLSTDLDVQTIECIQNAMKMVQTAADTTKVSVQVVRGIFEDLRKIGDKPHIVNEQKEQNDAQK
jgi:predicted HNH restriction endonuclease